MSRYADQYIVRFPEGLRDLIKEAAARNRRSMNAEMIFHLEKAMLINEARILFGDKAAAELAAKVAATGDSFAGDAPAAARDTSARQGADIHPR